MKTDRNRATLNRIRAAAEKAHRAMSRSEYLHRDMGNSRLPSCIQLMSEADGGTATALHELESAMSSAKFSLAENRAAEDRLASEFMAK